MVRAEECHRGNPGATDRDVDDALSGDNKLSTGNDFSPDLVSIVLPTHNRKSLLPRAISSVLRQTYSTFELIIVDDGSSDGTAQVVGAVPDPRIRYIRMPEKRGAAAARNRGIREARGQFLAFQDSDDEWVENKLERQLQCLREQDDRIGVVYTDMERIKIDGSTFHYHSPTVRRGPMIDRQRKFYQVFGLGIQSTLIRRRCFDEVGLFNEKYRCFEDLELFIRLSSHFEFFHLKEPLVRYYETVGVSSNRHAEFLARTMLLRKYRAEIWQSSPSFILREGAAACAGRCFERAKMYSFSRFLRAQYFYWRHRYRARFKGTP